MPSDRDVMRAVDLIGGFKPYHGTLPDYKIASKFTAPDSYGNFLRRVRKEDYCLLCFMFFFVAQSFYYFLLFSPIPRFVIS